MDVGVRPSAVPVIVEYEPSEPAGDDLKNWLLLSSTVWLSEVRSDQSHAKAVDGASPSDIEIAIAILFTVGPAPGAL